MSYILYIKKIEFINEYIVLNYKLYISMKPERPKKPKETKNEPRMTHVAKRNIIIIEDLDNNFDEKSSEKIDEKPKKKWFDTSNPKLVDKITDKIIDETLDKKSDEKSDVDNKVVDIDKTDEKSVVKPKKTYERLSGFKLCVEKVNIKKIINQQYLPILENTVETINKIVVHIYQFLKLYLLNLYEKNYDFPKIDESFIKLIGNVICGGTENGRKFVNTTVQSDLKQFFEDHYKQTMCDDSPNRLNMNRVLTYEETDIIKNIKNNISEHFVKHL